MKTIFVLTCIFLFAGCSTVPENMAQKAFQGMTKKELLEEIGVPSSTKGSMYFNKEGDIWYYWCDNPPVTVYFTPDGRIATWVTGAIGYTENLAELKIQKKSLAKTESDKAKNSDVRISPKDGESKDADKSSAEKSSSKSVTNLL